MNTPNECEDLDIDTVLSGEAYEGTAPTDGRVNGAEKHLFKDLEGTGVLATFGDVLFEVFFKQYACQDANGEEHHQHARENVELIPEPIKITKEIIL